MPKENKPTDKMIAALFKFKVPKDEILAMDFPTASAKLNQLITASKNRTSSRGGEEGRGKESYPSQPSTPTHQNANPQSKNLSTSPTGRIIASPVRQEQSVQCEAEIPLPEVLTNIEIDEYVRYAIDHVAAHFKLVASEVSRDNALVAMVFNAKLQQQQQRFNTEMSQRIEALNRQSQKQKEANIRKVQGV